jgi:hypothetical protein
MNSYRAYIDAQEWAYMNEDEKLEKKNSEILTLFSKSAYNTRQEMPKNNTSKDVTEHKRKCSSK